MSVNFEPIKVLVYCIHDIQKKIMTIGPLAIGSEITPYFCL
jgi:hypothetical protein